MKRTVKVWLAAVMSGVLLAGGAAMTGQAPVSYTHLTLPTKLEV